MDINPIKSKSISIVVPQKLDFTWEVTDLAKVLEMLLSAFTGSPRDIRTAKSRLETMSQLEDALTRWTLSMEPTRFSFLYLNNLCHLRFSLTEVGTEVIIEPLEFLRLTTTPLLNSSPMSPTWTSSPEPQDTL